MKLITTENILIEFTPEEAAVLFVVCDRIGGNPEGARGVFGKLRAVLEKAGFTTKYDGDNKMETIYRSPTMYDLAVSLPGSMKPGGYIHFTD